jgi:uncharacterized protein
LTFFYFAFMTKTSINQKLSEPELERLARHLEKMGPHAMNLECLDGFFSALICGAEPVAPSEYLPEIWGEEFVFDSEAQMAEIAELTSRHWNAIASGLERTLKHRIAHLPILVEDEDGIAHGNDWANGFLRGMRLRWASWGELMDSEEDGGSVIIIMAFAHEHHPDPSMRPDAVYTPEKRRELLVEMIASLARIYRYFLPHRRLTSLGPRPQRRAAEKIGRNDPCSCGSGKKYKHCCALTRSTLH